MSQQQQQSKLGTMKPAKVGGEIIKGKTTQLLTKLLGTKGVGRGGEKPKTKTKHKQMPTRHLPTRHSVEKSVKKTMGYK